MVTGADTSGNDDGRVDLFGGVAKSDKQEAPTTEYTKEEHIRADLLKPFGQFFTEATTRAACNVHIGEIREICSLDPECLTSKVVLDAFDELVELRIALFENRDTDTKRHLNSVLAVCAKHGATVETIELLLPISIARINARIAARMRSAMNVADDEPDGDTQS